MNGIGLCLQQRVKNNKKKEPSGSAVALKFPLQQIKALDSVSICWKRKNNQSQSFSVFNQLKDQRNSFDMGSLFFFLLIL